MPPPVAAPFQKAVGSRQSAVSPRLPTVGCLLLSAFYFLPGSTPARPADCPAPPLSVPARSCALLRAGGETPPPRVAHTRPRAGGAAFPVLAAPSAVCCRTAALSPSGDSARARRAPHG